MRRSGYGVVFALTVLSYVLCAMQAGAQPNPLAFIAQLATVAAALWVAEASPVVLRGALLALGGAAVAVVAVEMFSVRGHFVDIALSAASAIACLLTPAAIIAHQMRRRQVGIQNILAAVSAYVMVGMLFTFVYNLAALIAPGPVLSGETGDSLRGQLFFSFTTLTTTGYGNVVPLGPVIEAVAVAEAITGQLFIVIAIASMINLRRR